MNGMQEEIDQLRVNVSEMRKTIGFDDDLFDDLDDFDKKVSDVANFPNATRRSIYHEETFLSWEIILVIA